jgi:hypothetical protein
MFRYCLLILTGLSAAALMQEAHALSFYPARLEDKTAVYPFEARFDVKGDGVADDTDALQKAIDTVADATHQGIVFIPQGRYRLTRTLFVWPGVGLIGYGAERREFVLAAKTPGYQTGPSYIVLLTGGQTGERRRRGVEPPASAHPVAPVAFPGTVPATTGVVDANPGTFYSAISSFDGQREAAIRELEAGLALVHDSFRNVPTAIEIEPTSIDELPGRLISRGL